MSRYVDLYVEQDSDGFFDLVIDEDTADLTTTEGLESSIIASLFSDRRAAADEGISNPLQRRGWIGNMIAEVPGDNFGSGLWLYEQKRLTQEVATGLRLEAEQALDWMVEQSLATSVAAKVVMVPKERQALLAIDLVETSGDVTSRAYRLADATQRGVIARIGTFQGTSPSRDDYLLWGDEKLTWGGDVLTWGS